MATVATKARTPANRTGPTVHVPTVFANPRPSGANAQDWQQIQDASAKWGTPAGLIWGVYGLETAFGRNVATSSAKAQGKTQFIPSTAKQYNYPLTNTPTAAESAQQFDATAHYLADLFSKNGGSWDKALHSYSGGGYGLAQVLGKAKGSGITGPFNATQADVAKAQAQAAGSFSGQVQATHSGTFGFLADFIDVLTDPHTWLRVAEVIGGGLLLLMALKELTGGSVDPVGAVRRRL